MDFPYLPVFRWPEKRGEGDPGAGGEVCQAGADN
jgi:hypothetical protein